MDKYYKRKRNDATPDGSSGPEHKQLALVVVEQPTQNEEQRGEKPVIFEGIELLERDPALCPQIWQYPEHVRDEVRRAYMQLGPMQPKLKKYKPSGPQGHQRRFQFSWFHLFPSWLEYSESSGRAYCFFCFLCSKNIKKRSGFDVFTVLGFDGWKRVNDGKKCAFLAHVGSGPCSQHNNAVRDCQAILNQSNHIATIIEVQSNKGRYFRVEIFRATLDSQLTELNLKFNEKVMGLLSISGTLIPKHGFASFNAKDICKMVGKYYPADFTQQDMIGLEHQLNHFAHDAFNSEDLKKISTLTALCRCLVVTGRHMIYNFLDRLLRLLITLPVSTASAERAFSSLKIIKTRLRNKMEDNYLANSLLVQVEREIAAQYSYEDIMADFKARKDRRATL